jgi:uncharacterized 2Fe-2S/4Fe-4S cluster protein (DUF4445 family)
MLLTSSSERPIYIPPVSGFDGGRLGEAEPTSVFGALTMKRQTFRVTFQPEGRNVFVLGGTKIIEAAGQAGIILNTPCGGEGTCGKCRVDVHGPAPEPTEAERKHLTPQELAAGARLACQLVVDHDMVVSVPEGARFYEQVILTEGREYEVCHEPSVVKRFVSLEKPTANDMRSDMDRLQCALSSGGEPADFDLAHIRSLPGLLRASDFKVTVVQRGSTVLGLEAGDTTKELWGVAFDIGTTTIVGTLINMVTGLRAGVASRTNPQVRFGDDVVSRIRFASDHPHGLQELNKCVVNCLNDIIQELASAAHIQTENIYEVTAVGNTTMAHILLAINPATIAQAPYVSVFRESIDVGAAELGLSVNENANLHVLPNIAGFIGSDTVGVILAAGLMHCDDVKLAIDIGTNGEVVIGNKDRLLACSCAAGPAFEGARIRFGMRAADGAISKVVFNEEVEVSVIGGGRARGICGSGLLDVVAEMLRVGIVDSTGRMVSADTAPPSLPAGLRQALTTFDGQPAMTLVDAHESRTGEPIVITQRDVRELQLAKGAIWAGIQVLSEQFGVKAVDVSQILLAGGFGNFLRRSNAKRIGLLPDVPTARIEFIGNAAFVGARMALVCRSAREEAMRISEKVEYVELANSPDFQMLFAEAMMFPSA